MILIYIIIHLCNIYYLCFYFPLLHNELTLFSNNKLFKTMNRKNKKEMFPKFQWLFQSDGIRPFKYKSIHSEDSEFWQQI